MGAPAMDELFRNALAAGAAPSVPARTMDEVWRDMQQQQQRKAALGETTLEDFLTKAGVPATELAARANWLMMGPYAPPGMAMPASPLDAASIGGMKMPAGGGRKRMAADEGLEKTVERRQKRMIKNRESAARSRARKQAYTNELENKVSRLEEENQRLKKQKVLDTILLSAPAPEPKYQLRRTISSPL